MAPLSAAELVEHPEFESVIWDLKPAKKGKNTVAIGRGGPIRIAYEIHGNGPTKLVVGVVRAEAVSEYIKSISFSEAIFGRALVDNTLNVSLHVLCILRTIAKSLLLDVVDHGSR